MTIAIILPPGGSTTGHKAAVDRKPLPSLARAAGKKRWVNPANALYFNWIASGGAQFQQSAQVARRR